MRAAAVIELAMQYLFNGATMASSAAECIGNARILLEQGNEEAARLRALKALAYCVGVLHPAYAAATAPSTTGA